MVCVYIKTARNMPLGIRCTFTAPTDFHQFESHGLLESIRSVSTQDLSDNKRGYDQMESRLSHQWFVVVCDPGTHVKGIDATETIAVEMGSYLFIGLRIRAAQYDVFLWLYPLRLPHGFQLSGLVLNFEIKPGRAKVNGIGIWPPRVI